MAQKLPANVFLDVASLYFYPIKFLKQVCLNCVTNRQNIAFVSVTYKSTYKSTIVTNN